MKLVRSAIPALLVSGLTPTPLRPNLGQRGAYDVTTMGIVQEEPHVIDGLALMQAFLKITDAEDRRKVIELATALARASSPPLAPR